MRMIRIQNKFALGIISGLLGEIVILLFNRMFTHLGLVKNTLHSMSQDIVKYRRKLPFTTKKDGWLSYGISTSFCISGGLWITYLLSLNKRLFLLKAFLLGAVGGLIPTVFLKRFKIIKDFKKPVSKVMCLLSHGFFGLTVALTIKTFVDKEATKEYPQHHTSQN